LIRKMVVRNSCVVTNGGQIVVGDAANVIVVETALLGQETLDARLTANFASTLLDDLHRCLETVKEIGVALVGFLDALPDLANVLGNGLGHKLVALVVESHTTDEIKELEAILIRVDGHVLRLGVQLLMQGIRTLSPHKRKEGHEVLVIVGLHLGDFIDGLLPQALLAKCCVVGRVIWQFEQLFFEIQNSLSNSPTVLVGTPHVIADFALGASE
jgi:hypothetical protein